MLKIFKRYRPMPPTNTHLEECVKKLGEIIELSTKVIAKIDQGELGHEETQIFQEALDAVLEKMRTSSPQTKKQDRQLAGRQVYFNFNGESFDAFEILGIPNFVPVEFARDYYERKFAALPSGERVIYDAAIEALIEATGF